MVVGSEQKYDVIVLGVGAVGSATVYHLAKHGASVLGLEQWNVPNEKGSSSGITRIISPALLNKSVYVPIQKRSLELWHELQENHSHSLFRETGAIKGWTSPDLEGLRGTFSDTVQICEDNSIQYKTFTSDEIQVKHPSFDVPSNSRFIYQPDSGLLDPQESIIAHMNNAHEYGAEIHAQERVETWDVTEGGVVIQTTKRKYRAEKLVITSGPWMKDTGPGLDKLAPKRVFMGWFRPKSPENFSLDKFPCLSLSTEDGYIYGTPGHRINGIKLGWVDNVKNTPTIDPDDIDDIVTIDEEKNLREIVAKYLPDAIGSTLRLTSCVITLTPDMDYIIDKHPEYERVYMAGGFSGSGFGTSTAVGEILAKKTLGKQTQYNLDHFSVSRL